MRTSHQRWLLEQIPQWERDGLVTADSSVALQERYAIDDSQPGLAQMVMGALGALLIGSGLIAVIGYNWDDFSRPIRLLFAFLPLLGTQIFSFWVLRRGESLVAWVRETAGLLQALATGACIALVSQIYHIGGEWPDFLFCWMLLSLPLTWVLRSHAVAIFYLIAIAVWSISTQSAEYGKLWYDSPMLYPLLLLGLLPFWPSWPCKAPLSIFMRWVMTISAIFGLFSAAFFACVKELGYGGAWWICAVSAAIIALFPLNPSGIAEPTERKPQVLLGALWLLGYGIAITFRSVGDDLFKGISHTSNTPWCLGLLAVLAALGFMAIKHWRWGVLAIASIALLPLVAFPFAQGDGAFYSTALSWLATLHLATTGLTMIVPEFLGRRGAPRLGATLLSVLTIARMADSHFSLLTKGIAFIAVGVTFLAFNVSSSRKGRHPQSSQS
ncbi:MAG: DUF2157 domain-containing protein [Verrucomicrobiota bacterium]